jgi:hypothetical protein
MGYGNGELRWSFGETTLWGQHLRFMLVPFIDTGRVFDSVRDTTLKDWKFRRWDGIPPGVESLDDYQF